MKTLVLIFSLCLSASCMAGVTPIMMGYGAGASATATPSATPAPTPQFVQEKIGFATAGNFTVNFDNPITTGNTIIICVTHSATTIVNRVRSTPGLEVSATDVNGSHTAHIGTASATEIWWLDGIITGETGINVRQSTGLTEMLVSISEWSGLAPLGVSSSEDANGNDNPASDTVTTGSVSTAGSNDLIVATGGWVANDYSSGPINGFTRLTPVSGTAFFQEIAYIVQSPASNSTSWSLTTGIDWSASIAAFSLSE